MENEDALAVTNGVGRQISPVRSQARRNLCLENSKLRSSLALANEAASLYAVLLREGDHRIKNSLAIVSSLMRLQAGSEESSSAREALRMAAARIQSIAQIHDTLQVSAGQDLVDLGAVLEKICAALQSMGGAARGVNIRANLDSTQLPVAYAQPIVLAVNELIVNALRHAFPNERAGLIEVSVCSIGGQLRIVVADNGVGTSAASVSEGRGYGMQLIRMMVGQIHGVLYVNGALGTEMTILAPMPLSAPAVQA